MELEKIIRHIQDTIHAEALRLFLTKLISSSNVNENLLCFCVLIEIKNQLLSENNYLNIIESIKSLGEEVSFESFTNRLPISFSKKYLHPISYSRVVNKAIFERFIGSFNHNNWEIMPDKIAVEGWSTSNDVVWITPRQEIFEIIEESKEKEYPANDICDYVGFARTEIEIMKAGRKAEFGIIHYSENFDEPAFQPNASNVPNWFYQNILFISYDTSDGFGRTYNGNGINYAKEHVHKKSYYYDERFEVEYIGEASVDDLFTRSGILEEAFKRLDI